MNTDNVDNVTDVNVDDMDGNGFSPLMWSAYYGQLPTVRLLIQHQAKINLEVRVARPTGNALLVDILISSYPLRFRNCLSIQLRQLLKKQL